jgi:hypothetical protein
MRDYDLFVSGGSIVVVPFGRLNKFYAFRSKFILSECTLQSNICMKTFGLPKASRHEFEILKSKLLTLISPVARMLLVSSSSTKQNGVLIRRPNHQIGTLSCICVWAHCATGITALDIAARDSVHLVKIDPSE